MALSFRPLRADECIDVRGPQAYAPLWAAFGDFYPRNYDGLVSVFMWAYILIGSVIMVNLLVAMFSTTFSRVVDHSEDEYVHFQCERMFVFKDINHPVPPVINMPIALWKLARYAFDSIRTGVHAVHMKWSPQKGDQVVEEQVAPHTEASASAWVKQQEISQSVGRKPSEESVEFGRNHQEVSPQQTIPSSEKGNRLTCPPRLLGDELDRPFPSEEAGLTIP